MPNKSLQQTGHANNGSARRNVNLRVSRLLSFVFGEEERIQVSPLPSTATDADLLAFTDRWAALMEAEDYQAAYAFTDHDPHQGWTADLMREVIKSYGDAREDQRVTVEGVPSDVNQRKEVSRWEPNEHGLIGEIWYDLNIDGVVSDLTAIFQIERVRKGIVVRLNDIHVM